MGTRSHLALQWVELCFPQSGSLSSKHLVPVNVTLFGNRILRDDTKLKGAIIIKKVGPWSNKSNDFIKRGKFGCDSSEKQWVSRDRAE